MPTIAFCRSMMTRAVFFESRFNEFNVAPKKPRIPSTFILKIRECPRFCQILYGDAATMTTIAEPKEASALNCWSALDVRTRHAPHICDGKFNAELGSIVWIVLSP